MLVHDYCLVIGHNVDSNINGKSFWNFRSYIDWDEHVYKSFNLASPKLNRLTYTYEPVLPILVSLELHPPPLTATDNDLLYDLVYDENVPWEV